MERVMAGPERKSRVITEGERRIIAYHESGHALVGHVLAHSDPIHKISIVSRGQALGYTMQIPEEDHFLETRDGMLDQIAVLLAGRTAEELFCDDVTTGASNDLERATKLARTMVTRYGMSDELGAQVFGEAQHEVFLGRDYANHQDYSAETAKRIDDEVERIMREGHERAREVLAERRDQMDTMARVLLERETVEGRRRGRPAGGPLGRVHCGGEERRGGGGRRRGAAVSINEKSRAYGAQKSSIREISAYANARKAEIGAENVFDFSLGNPSIPAPDAVRASIERALALPATQLHGYTPASGLPAVREAVAASLCRRFGEGAARADDLYLTCGAAASLSITFNAIVNPGDEVIVIAP